MQTFVGNHDVDRIASVAGPSGAALAAVLLLTLPGIPSIYYGDEQAFTGVKGSGFSADDPVRPPLPATPEELAPLGEWMHALYRELIASRRRHPWLVDAGVEVLETANESISYVVRSGTESLSVHLTIEPTATARLEFSDGETAEYAW